jgi:hypothetical protein
MTAMTDELFKLELERAEALGHVLGMIDAILMFQDYDQFTPQRLEKLRELRKAYSDVSKRYLDARLQKAGLA